MANFFLLFLSPLLVSNLNLPPSTAQDHKPITDPSYYYNLCSTSTCNHRPLPYPFGVPTFCHHPSFNTSCPAGDVDYIHVWSTGQTGIIRISGDLVGNSLGTTILNVPDALFSCGQLSSPSFNTDNSIFNLLNNYTYGTHLNCTKPPSSLAGLQPASCLRCANGTDQSNVCYYSPGFVVYPNCENFFVYLPAAAGFNITAVKDLRGYLQKGYVVNYSKAAVCQGCEGSGGRCGANPAGDFVCFCKDSVHTNNCSDGVFEDLRTWFPNHGDSAGSASQKTRVIAISASASVLVTIILIAVLLIFTLRRMRQTAMIRESFAENGILTLKGFEGMVDGISPTRYSYSQIKKFTNNFSSKIGEGGFGNIYKGVIKKRQHEMQVAVKVLKVSKQSEKQFMNEVATIGRIHHNNLVRMLGYCVQGKKRALVYEYMENGSLDKYIYMTKGKESAEMQDEISNKLEHHPSPKQMHTIALEIARGLLYLHEGCRSRILHFDIKPHNVLLDSRMSAKVSDFGLARLIDKDCSHVSLTLARGTPGYAAPEMWSKAYGPITDKSDVYSYGMLILEMVGGKIKHDSDGDALPRQVDLPDWVFKNVNNRKLEEASRELGNHHQTIDGENDGKSEEEITERMCLVGLWCIQHIPTDRPSMSRVVQYLEGNAEITMPPDPFPFGGGNEQPGYLTSSIVYLSTMESYPTSTTVYLSTVEETR